MTGFGTGSAEAEGLRVRVVLRSVNGRFLDLGVRCPTALQELEPQIRERIQARLSRGKVTGTVEYEQTGEGGALPELDDAVAAQYLKELERLARLAGTGPADLELLARMPGVFRSQAGVPDVTRLEALLACALDGAMDELEGMRQREGDALAADLRARLNTLGQLAERIAALAAAGRDEVRRRLREKVDTLLRPGELDEDRLATEVVLIAERSDITEELVRLRSHCQQFAEALDRGGDVGRRLNFLLQEMHREINTIASKSADGGIIHCTVDAKEEAERLREQVQNLA